MTIRLTLDPYSGLMVDLHLGHGLWLRMGWYPAHRYCEATMTTPTLAHRCWARRLPARTFETGTAT